MNPLEQHLKNLQIQENSLKKLLTCAISDKDYLKADEYKYHLEETRNEIRKILNEVNI